jgi:hypothetical protein
MSMSTSQHYELFGGPLDGASLMTPKPLKEHARVSLNLVRKDFMPDLKESVSIPFGRAIFIMQDGRLTFDRIVPNLFTKP